MTDQATVGSPEFMSRLREGMEDQPAAPAKVETLDKYVPAKYRSAGSDTMEQIQGDMRRMAADMDQQLDAIRKRFETQFAAAKAAIDEVKRLAG